MATLTVTDNSGASANKSVTITVTASASALRSTNIALAAMRLLNTVTWTRMRNAVSMAGLMITMVITRLLPSCVLLGYNKEGSSDERKRRGEVIMRAKAGYDRRWIIPGLAVVCAVFSFMFFSGGCKKESSSEKAGREARETFEKSRELLKEGFDKTKDLTKEGLEKGGEAAKEGLEKSQEAAKAFSKGWKEGGKQ